MLIPSPWGKLNKLLLRCPIGGSVTYLGAVSAEDRCIGVSNIHGISIAEKKFLRISHPDATDPWCVEWKRKEEKNLSLIKGTHGQIDLHEVELMCPAHQIRAITESIKFESVLLDVSCMPKRFFFFILKSILEFSHVQNVYCLYCSPQQYASDHLAKSPLDPAFIDGFGIESPSNLNSNVIISMGFEPLGLANYIETLRGGNNISVIFPFPSDSCYQRRNARSLQDVLSGRASNSEGASGLNERNTAYRDAFRVNSYDLFGCYRQIFALNGASGVATLLPYGPKTHSLAMALFAIKNKAPICYTQPQVYNPNYSTGCSSYFAYILKQGGRVWPFHSRQLSLQ
jgi:hypothetical protein